MTPDEYCQDKAAGSGSSFYYSFLFLPARQRQAIVALYAFCREVDDVVDECTDAGVARLKLQWWREEIERLYEGQPRHPVTKALATALEHFDLPREQFQEIIDGMEMDLDRTRYASYKDLALYCHRVAGVVGLLSAEVFGYEDRRTLKYAHELGLAFQLTNILRDVREDAERGRIYIPLDELARFGVTELDLVHARPSPAFTQLMGFQAERARQSYAQAFALLPEIDRLAQRSGIIMAAIYQATLDEIAADGYRVLEHRISLTPLRKLWIAWTTARRERRRHRRYQRQLRRRARDRASEGDSAP
ncbi:MAG TPA: presqualene diphosphate synthase HpnD [Gammaproteobacteria bacterium]|nr:presqualene diphosphate synthase HpnD [Gammaproteobacteria bacterium]